MDKALKEVIDVNQNMIEEWKRECKLDGYAAAFMVVVDMKDSAVRDGMHLFRSEGMPIEAVIRQLRHIANQLEANNYKAQS